ncbi:unnamed protein product, partial [Heligmosomoides polygyrus]|uniref:MIF4G_like_2 domain-containing protein n=1 Tax=Heligmosomoides polygyrus TaxID=6339 RepID=A0A183GU87_HELPZ
VEFVASTAASVSLDPALLFVQNLYKALVENANTSEMRLMDRLDLALSAMQSSGVEKVVGSVSRVVSDCRIGVVPDCLDEMIALLRVVTQLFSSMNAHISAALSSFASLYYTLLSMSMYLFEKHSFTTAVATYCSLSSGPLAVPVLRFVALLALDSEPLRKQLIVPLRESLTRN